METVTLKSIQNETFEVNKRSTEESTVLKDMFEDVIGPLTIPIQADTPILAFIAEYFNNLNHEDKDGWTQGWVETLFANHKPDVVLQVMKLVNFLYIPSLLDIMCRHAAKQYIEGKSKRDICGIFGLPDDFTFEQRKKEQRDVSYFSL